MARIRTIKPDFFLSETVASVCPLARLLFQGLWLLADREGRLHDKPGKIKVQVLPWDKCDADALLLDLDRVGLIRRYEVDGERCIQITSFLEHQRPNTREPDSTIPAEHPLHMRARACACEALPCTCVHARKGREGNGEREGNGKGKGSVKIHAESVPDGLRTDDFLKAWDEWTEYRSQAKFKPWAQVTIAAKMKEFAKAGPVASAAAIRNSIANGWQGIFLDKRTSPANGPRKTGSTPDRDEAYANLGKDRIIDMDALIDGPRSR